MTDPCPKASRFHFSATFRVELQRQSKLQVTHSCIGWYRGYTSQLPINSTNSQPCCISWCRLAGLWIGEKTLIWHHQIKCPFVLLSRIVAKPEVVEPEVCRQYFFSLLSTKITAVVQKTPLGNFLVPDHCTRGNFLPARSTFLSPGLADPLPCGYLDEHVINS